MVIFNIATVPYRTASFMNVLGCLSKQTVQPNCLNIAFSYEPSDAILEFCHTQFPVGRIIVGTFTAAAKMFAVDDVPNDSYFITFDDDLKYPPDYVARLLSHLRTHRDEVVGFHGMSWPEFPVKEFYDRKLWQYFDDVYDNHEVHVIGTGVAGFYTDTLRQHGFTYDYFNQFPDHGNVNDMLFAQFLRDRGIRMTVLAHEKGWIHFFPGTQDRQALWKQSPGNKVTEMLYLQRGQPI